jgi:hypothetical protein
MHHTARLVAAALLAAPLAPRSLAQDSARKPDPPATAATAAAASTSASPDGDRLTPSELEELLGSIALYPDPLLANVLAASVYPDEVASAAAFVKGGGAASAIEP